MDYRLIDPLVKIAKGLADLLTGEAKIYVEAPFTDDDRIISVVDKDFEVE